MIFDLRRYSVNNHSKQYGTRPMHHKTTTINNLADAACPKFLPNVIFTVLTVKHKNNYSSSKQ